MNRKMATAWLLLLIGLAAVLLVACVRQPLLPSGSQFELTETGTSTGMPDSSSSSIPSGQQPSTTTEFTTDHSDDRVYGNGGSVVQQGDWIYYPVAEMQALDQAFGLYRVRADGTERTLLYEGFRIHSLYIVDDWIHFVQSTTVEDGTPISVSLKKIRTDGSSPMNVLTLDGLDIDQMQILDDWIYLGCVDDTWLPSIQRLRMDGSGLESILEGYSFKSVNDDSIFALTDHNEIVRISLPDHEVEPIGPDIVAGGDLSVRDGWVYYCNETDLWSLYRIRTDGTGRQRLTSEPTFNFYLDGESIYYQLERAEANLDITGGELVQISLDGSGRRLITDVSPAENGFVYLVATLNDWLYLHEITFDEMGAETYRSRLYRIDSTGGGQMDIVAYDCIMAG